MSYITTGRISTRPVILFAIFAICICSVANAADPLPSWNEGPAKKALLEFVAATTDNNGKDYVKPAERIAVFDNDGTLWVEYPMYTQALFAFDRVKALAPQHPEWKTTQPFKALLEGDMKTVGASGMKGLMPMIGKVTSERWIKPLIRQMPMAGSSWI
jgi:hypothetical protein